MRRRLPGTAGHGAPLIDHHWEPWALTRAGSAAAVLVAAFEADYHGSGAERPRFAVVTAAAAVLEAASRLVGVHSLRVYDAVQLASAKATSQAVPECRTVAVFDITLRAAAAAEGFALLPG